MGEFSGCGTGRKNSSRAWKTHDLEEKDLKTTISGETIQIKFKGIILKRRKKLRERTLEIYR